MVFLHSYCVGRHIVVFLFICTTCTVTVGISPLSSNCFVAVCHSCIFTGIVYAFISVSFSGKMKATMPCSPGTTIALLIDTSYHRIDSFSFICSLSLISLHTLCIRIVLRLPSEKYAYQYTKSTFGNILMWV